MPPGELGSFSICHGCGGKIHPFEHRAYDKGGNLIHSRKYCRKLADRKVDFDKKPTKA